MPTRVEILSSFLPDVGIARARSGLPSRPEGHARDCGVLFADIAGFTPLAERLAKRGPEGAEELTHHLNRVFGRLTELVRAHGGDTLKFAGDALLAIWPAQDEATTLERATLRSAQCALAIPAALEEAQRGEPLNLSLKLSVGCGRVTVAALGGLRNRWELFVAGDPLAQAARTNAHAPTGAVVLSDEARQLLGDGVRVAPTQGGWLLERIEVPVPVVAARHLPPSEDTEPALRTLVPGAIRARLDAGLSEWIAELRRLTILFVRLPDLSADPEIARAQQAIEAIQRALYRYEGSLNKLNADDKGVSVLAALGLPPFFHADDAARGVRAALDIERELTGLSLRTSIGVTTGQVFCGSVGGVRRREYTIMGDPANLAARLMQSHERGVHCDLATVQGAGPRQGFRELAPLRLKGKAEPVQVFTPEQCKGRTEGRGMTSDAPLIGRDAELARLEHVLATWTKATTAPDRPGGCVLLRGRSGMGKSAVVRAFAQRAAATGVRVLPSSADALERQAPYQTWRPVVARLFAADSEAPAETTRERVRVQLAATGGSAAEAPLLNPVLGLGEAESELTRALEPRERAQRTCDVICRVLARAASEDPVLVVIEDVQWLDAASWALVQGVAARVRSALLLLTFRPEEPGAHDEIEELRASARPEEIALGELSASDILEIVRRRLEVRDLPPELCEALAERAEGNPLFAEELAWTLRDSRDLLNPEARGGMERAPGREALPPTLQAALTQRIDQLGAQEQLALKVASVVGVEFSTETLRHVYPMDIALDVLEEHCSALEARELTTQVAQASEGRTYRFKSRTAHEVAYQLLLFAQRRSLHRRVAEWFEGSSGDLSSLYAVLAHHWRTAADGPVRDGDGIRKALAYLEAAAEQAAYSYANPDAIRFCREALELLSWLPQDAETEAQELALRLSLGSPLVSVTSWANAEVESNYRRAQQLAARHGSTAQRFQALRGLWQFHVGTSDYAEAERLGQDLLQSAQRAGDRRLLLETYRMLGTTAFWLGHIRQACERMQAAIELVEPGADDELVSLYGQDPEVANRGILAWALCLQGDEQAGLEQAARAVERARSLDHPFTLAFAFGSAMWAHVFLRNPEPARVWAERTLQVSQDRGFAYLATAGRVVRGWAVTLLGDPSGVDEVKRALQDWRGSGASIGMPIFLLTLADVYFTSGRIDEARAVLADPVLLERGATEGWLEPMLRGLRALILHASRSAEAPGALHDAVEFAQDHGALLVERRLREVLRQP